jgi:hypothetical protein
MKTTVIGYAVALSLALVGAYQTWTHEGDPDLSDATVILDADRDALERVTFDSPTVVLTLEPREDERGAFVWGVVTPKPAEEGAEAEPEPEQTFKVGPAGETLMDGMAPFVAKRVLEGVDASKLEELGFGENQATLTIQRAGKEPKAYEVGERVYGGRNRYVRDPDDGTVYIVATNVVQQLETGATTLPDRSLVGVDTTDIETITVRGGEAEVAYVQNNPDDRAARFWARQGSSEPNAAAAGWFDKVLNLRIATYIDDANRPAGLEEAYSMVVTAGRTSTEVVVYRAFDDEGQEVWYASSPHNRALVQLNASRGTEVYADLASVLDGGA